MKSNNFFRWALGLGVIVVTTQSVAIADSFTVIREGKNYFCQESTPADPALVVECANKAFGGPFTADQAKPSLLGRHLTNAC
jgi:hypothetical protein